MTSFQTAADSDADFLDFMDRVPQYVPGKARLVVFGIELIRQMGDVPTLAKVAVQAGCSEAVTGHQVLQLLERGLAAWDADGLRNTLPGRS